MQSKNERLFGWGHAPVADCVSFRPEKRRELDHLIRNHPAPLIARGLGRSYGDASLQPQGVIRTERFDHLIEFDQTQGIIRAQAGVSLSDVMDFAIPKGFIPPVLPGTRYATLGGAFACNIHGKNHFRDGDLAEHVHSIRLTRANGQTIECSPNEHSEYFWATAGGMGMTGIIEDITLRLRPISSTSLQTTTYQTESIEDMVAAFESYRNHCDYMVGWIDHMPHGGEVGRGVFEAASHITREEGGRPLSEYKPLKPGFSVPFFMPSMLLNRYSMAAYNKHRFKRYSNERRVETVDFNGFFHPLDRIGSWYKLYGKRGFFQYQCVIPETLGIASQLQKFLSALQEHKLFSYLAVIKYHREGKGYLTFPMRGYSLALDFPNTARVRSLVPQLNRWVAEQGGRVYLAKDALLDSEQFEQMYGEAAAAWREVIRDIDPHSRFTSMMSERLEWKSSHVSL
jgi:decaprenylphospho-beta-D-ribofuranose 2-oxidase